MCSSWISGIYPGRALLLLAPTHPRGNRLNLRPGTTPRWRVGVTNGYRVSTRVVDPGTTGRPRRVPVPAITWKAVLCPSLLCWNHYKVQCLFTRQALSYGPPSISKESGTISRGSMFDFQVICFIYVLYYTHLEIFPFFIAGIWLYIYVLYYTHLEIFPFFIAVIWLYI